MIFRIGKVSINISAVTLVTHHGPSLEFEIQGARRITSNPSVTIIEPGATEGSDGTLSLIEQRLAEAGQYILAIKAHRDRTGLGLRESKEAVDRYKATETFYSQQRQLLKALQAEMRRAEQEPRSGDDEVPF